MEAPQLVLLKQTSSSEEKYTRNGIISTASVVIKNTPFTIQIGITRNVLNDRVLDFNSLTLDWKLVYDTDGPEKYVDFVRSKPLEVKAHTSDRGDTWSCEAKIKVLTSQHEDLFFRIKFIALDPTTGKEFQPPFSLLSGPIKVISKPEQLKRSSIPASKPAVPADKKRTLQDLLVESVHRLEQAQQEQTRTLQLLLERGAGNVPPTSFLFSDPTEYGSKKQKEKDSDEFEGLFARAVQAYRDIPVEHRPQKNPEDVSCHCQF